MIALDAKATLQKAVVLMELYEAAQKVVDIERPGEKVQDVLINTDSASSLKDTLTPKPKKTVYNIRYFTLEKTVTLNPGLPRKSQFDEIQPAIEELLYLRENYMVGFRFFIEKSEVEA